MSKYNHFEMCEKIFGEKYKSDKSGQYFIPYSRTDMWEKLIEFEEENNILKKALFIACKNELLNSGFEVSDTRFDVLFKANIDFYLEKAKELFERK